MRFTIQCVSLATALAVCGSSHRAAAAEVQVREVKDGLEIETDQISARVNAKGYVSGIAAGSFLDKKTGAREVGFGLHIMDFLMAPGWRDDGYTARAEAPRRTCRSTTSKGRRSARRPRN